MLSIFASIVLFAFPSAHAYLENARLPVCPDNGQAMEFNNAEILRLKATSRNQTLARAYVQGTVTQADHRKNDHDHFVISIGPKASDQLEIIYNDDREFGPLGQIQVGDSIIVCGDYITSTARAKGYEPSPQGAIIHWTHYNPGTRPGTHDHGFLMIRDRTLVGFDEAPPAAWDGKIVRPSGANSPKSSRPRDRMSDGDPCESEDDCAA